jgi:hypothetical protein
MTGANGRSPGEGRSESDERWQLLEDLSRQLPATRGVMRQRTVCAIRQLEMELAGGRGVAAREATPP